MSTTYFLCADLHAVRIGDDLVFLDVAAERYLCWPGTDGLDLSGDRRRLKASDPAVAGELEAAGLVSRVTVAHTPTAAPVPVEGDLYDLAPRPLSWADRADFLRASVDGAAVYPRRTFADLMAFAAARREGAAPDASPTPEMVALVGSFHRWACWTPAPAKCLIRSFMLLRVLRRHGLDARWIFAVKTWPFDAHCWLQAGGIVLDDARDRLTAYHPILVV
jgi:hypothetical protein